MSIHPVLAATKNSHSGVLDFNFYPYLSDIDSDTVFTLNLAAVLQAGFSYFSLTNFANQQDSTEWDDINAFYTEQNIRWKIKNLTSLDLTEQFNFRSGENNDRHRLGVRWRLNDTPALQSTLMVWKPYKCYMMERLKNRLLFC